MGTITDPMLNEFRQEVATTKRVLERVPCNEPRLFPSSKVISLWLNLGSRVVTREGTGLQCEPRSGSRRVTFRFSVYPCACGS